MNTGIIQEEVVIRSKLPHEGSTLPVPSASIFSFLLYNNSIQPIFPFCIIRTLFHFIFLNRPKIKEFPYPTRKWGKRLCSAHAHAHPCQSVPCCRQSGAPRLPCIVPTGKLQEQGGGCRDSGLDSQSHFYLIFLETRMEPKR